MATNFWINLPAHDLARSRDFFARLGFAFNDRAGGTGMVSMVLGQAEVIVNLFPAASFAAMAGLGAGAAQGNEVLLSIGVDSRAEVDQLTDRARTAGATVFCEPMEVQGWMYGSGFVDLDGHRWNVLYMDLDKAAAARPN